MPPTRLFDIEAKDEGRVLYSREEIYQRFLPHRHEFAVLDGVRFFAKDPGRILGFADIRADAFWVRGHIPGKPILPGVLMLEMAGQLSSVAATLNSGVASNRELFIAFGGVEDCKFRDAVVPPSRLTMLGLVVEQRPRRIITKTQGFQGDRIAFEATIIGLAMK